MSKTVILAQRPDLVLKLEKYGLVPKGHEGGKYEGCAKEWAKEGKPPYDTPEYQALAERLPTGWEELTEEELNQLLKDLATAIEKKKMASKDLPNKGGETLLKNLTKTMYLGIAIAITLLKENGIGILPDKDEKEASDAQEFSFELILHILNGSEALKSLFKTIAKSANTSSDSQNLIAEILQLMALTLMLVAGSQGNEEKMKALFISFISTLKEGVKKTEQLIKESLNKGTIQGEEAERISLYLHQAHLALDKEDLDSFYEAFTDSLALIDIEPERLFGDLKNLQKFAELLQDTLTTGMEKETKKISTVSQAM